MSGYIKLEVLTSVAEMEGQVKQILQKKTALVLQKIAPRIELKTKQLLTQAIIDSPEYNSLQSGDLREHFGLEYPNEALSQIVTTIANSVVATYNAPNSLIITILNKDYQNILQLSVAEYYSLSRRGTTRIPWLEWLLLEEGKPIVLGFKFDNTEPRPYSRTGSAVMQKSSGRDWSVPHPYTGNANNNWLTRAVDSIADIISGNIRHEFLRGIGA